jgi:aryl-alcohol dehydrogenase-like predicted oxidoreductase
MRYRSLGRTGVQVSELCLGTMNFGGSTDEAESVKIIDAAIQAGINFIDTADCYNQGQSEEIIGRALEQNGKRSRIVLATKVHVSMDDTDPNACGNHRRHVIEGCHDSLRRLDTDYIDLYYIHRSSTQVPIDETLRALDDLVRSGKVRYIGTSDFAAWKIVESLWVSKEYGLNRFVCEQASYHLLDRRAERDLLPMAQTYGIAVTAWSPLAGGFLTGKYKRDGAQPAQARFQRGGEPNAWVDRHFVDGAFDVIETVTAITQEKGCTPAQFSLAWIAQQPGMLGPVLGPRTFEQFQEQLGTLDVTITDEDRERIDRVSPPGRVIVPYYLSDDYADFRPNQHWW